MVPRAGDYVTFEALADVVAVMSACPMDINPINGREPRDVAVEVAAEAEGGGGGGRWLRDGGCGGCGGGGCGGAEVVGPVAPGWWGRWRRSAGGGKRRLLACALSVRARERGGGLGAACRGRWPAPVAVVRI
jgi:hypothetical protein